MTGKPFICATFALVCLPLLVLLAKAPAINAQSNPQWTATEELTYPLSARGSFSLENTNGRSQVEGAEKSEVHIVARKTLTQNSSFGGSITDEEAQSKLAALRVVVEHSADSVRVVTHYPTDSGFGYKVDYDVLVPSGAQVTAETTNGDVAIMNLIGPVEAEATNGAITIDEAKGGVEAKTTNGVITVIHASGEISAESTNGSIDIGIFSLPVASVECKSTNGEIRVGLPEDAAFDLDASTDNGRVVCGFTLGADGQTSKTELKGPVNGGGASVSLETTNGAIAVLRATDLRPARP